MAYTVRNAHTGEIYFEAPTLQAARNFCGQRLLRSAASREGFLSNLAAGVITVYDASHTIYSGAGF